MDLRLILIISAVVVLIVLIIVMTALSRKNNARKKGAYDKTGKWNAATGNAAPNSPVNITIDEIPRLSAHEKTEIRRKIEEDGRTEVLECNKDRDGILVHHGLSVPSENRKPRALLKYKENGRPMQYEMYGDFVSIGRDPEKCHLVISGDNYLGKHHAILFFKDGRFFVADINSRNGSFIDNGRIEGSMEITNNCRLTLAKTEIEFVIL